jgi:uncharacterized protein with NAD-binding domain and iron-sulfur cluster
MAAITAAFELTRPEHGGKYQVTVYQQGWRLGGKGTSGRGPSGRIEEHGMHLWFGWYENAFRLIRECYAELGRNSETCPIADWRDAFSPAAWVTNMDVSARGDWLSRTAQFIPFEGLPGDPGATNPIFSVPEYLARVASLLRTMVLGVETLGPRGVPLRSARPGIHVGDGTPAPPSLDALIGNMVEIMRHGVMSSTAVVVQSLALLEVALRSLSDHTTIALLRSIGDMTSWLRASLTMLAFDEQDRFKAELIDVMSAIVVGITRFGLLNDPRGLDAIDNYELRAWLRLNGAAERSVQSAFVQGLYDLALAYEAGDPGRPALAAGQGLRGFFRMFFGHRGPLAWKLRAGMGDVIFAPFYEVLSRRGVKFEFFHRLDNVRIAESGGTRYVSGLDLAVQAETVDGPYDPLVDVSGLPCWPSSPDFSQLRDGTRLKEERRAFESAWDNQAVRHKTLLVTEHFDFVVLGVSIGEIPRVCREILAVDERWRAMVRNVKTVATQAFQVWLRTDLQETGWLSPDPTVSAFVKPFDTWADMSQVIPYEDWQVLPGAVAYFCNVLPDPPSDSDTSSPDYPGRRQAEVRANAIRFLKTNIRHLWPRAINSDGEFRWELLANAHTGGHSVSGEPQPGELRFDTQFWTANINPSDRYVLSLPGSSKFRISPLDRTYDNLTIAGDWTDCGFNVGCVEAAVISGRLAAHALTLSPPLDDIVGYHHP